MSASEIEHRSTPTVCPGVRGARVLITGATSGVGLAAAEEFGDAGAHLALLARNGERLDGIARRTGESAIALPTDVRDPAAVAAAVGAATAHLGGLDVVVNCAGTGMPTPLAQLDAAAWRDVINTNLSGTFYVARESGLWMRDHGGGVIVNIGSELSLIGMGMYSAYCASKFGVVGLSKALAAELAPSVRVNVLCPGPIDTPMMDAELAWYPDPDAARQGAIKRVPLKRFAQPSEVVRAIGFLAFDAPYATGSVLSLDGGTTVV